MLGTETTVLLFGDLAKNGKQQFLAANVVPKTSKNNNIAGTIITRAVIAQNDDGQWHTRATPRSPRGTRTGRAKHLIEVRAMLGVLGLDPLSRAVVRGRWVRGPPRGHRRADDRGPGPAPGGRARKDWDAADAIRDGLIAAGIVIEDTPSGTRWELGR